jgi:hypothetical protein
MAFLIRAEVVPPNEKDHDLLTGPQRLFPEVAALMREVRMASAKAGTTPGRFTG